MRRVTFAHLILPLLIFLISTLFLSIFSISAYAQSGCGPCGGNNCSDIQRWCDDSGDGFPGCRFDSACLPNPTPAQGTPTPTPTSTPLLCDLTNSVCASNNECINIINGNPLGARNNCPGEICCQLPGPTSTPPPGGSSGGIECNPTDPKPCPDNEICLLQLESDGYHYRCNVILGPIPAPTNKAVCDKWERLVNNNWVPASEGEDGAVCREVNTAIGWISTDPKNFVTRVFSIVLGLAGGIALILIILSGYRFMASQGNPEALQEARGQLISAIIGLLFIILSFVILQVIGVDILHIPGFE